MAPKKKEKADKELKERELAVSQVRQLLELHWDDIKFFRDRSPDKKTTVGFNLKVDESGPKVDVATGISMGITKKDTIKDSFDPSQEELELDDKKKK